jgi:hypothetical protein
MPQYPPRKQAAIQKSGLSQNRFPSNRSNQKESSKQNQNKENPHVTQNGSFDTLPLVALLRAPRFRGATSS